MLAPAVVKARVIPNGVDRRIFCPGERNVARAALSLPLDAPILLFVGNGIRAGAFKDYSTLSEVIARLANRKVGQDLILLALGEEGPPKQVGNATIRFVPPQHDAGRVALYYRAATCYVHAARADTFPNTILEALACGIPVVATAVCGIPEQVRALRHLAVPLDLPVESPERATGLLVPSSNADAMAKAVEDLLANPDLHRRLSVNAAADARLRFDLQDQVDRYLQYYRELLDWKKSHDASAHRAGGIILPTNAGTSPSLRPV
jgi:glycosyltransferase involved in cell wall biosynthesis